MSLCILPEKLYNYRDKIKGFTFQYPDKSVVKFVLLHKQSVSFGKYGTKDLPLQGNSLTVKKKINHYNNYYVNDIILYVMWNW